MTFGRARHLTIGKKPPARTRARYALTPLAIILLATGSPAAYGAEPVLDPLSRLSEQSSENEFVFTLMFIPDGAQGLAPDSSGVIYPYTRNTYTTSLQLAGKHELTDRAALTLTASATRVSDAEALERADGTQTRNESTATYTWGAGIRYRLIPQHPMDPSIQVFVENPCCLRAEIGTHLIRDPLVLTGSLGYSHALEHNGSGIQLGWGAGFIANDRINLSLSVKHFLPLQPTRMPKATISLRTGFGMDAAGRNEIVLVSTLMGRGDGNNMLGIGLEWHVDPTP